MQMGINCTVQFLCQLLSVPRIPLCVRVYTLSDLETWASGAGSKRLQGSGLCK